MGKTLEDLQAEGLDQETFVTQHPTPAILIAIPDEESGGGDVGMHTEILSSTMIKASLESADKALLRTSRLEFLNKSDRNPFQNLIMVGRARTNDVVLRHPGVSKVHATFSQVGGEWFIQDGKSRNGTYHNGEQLETGAKVALEDGDGVGFGGKVVARFLLPASLWEFVSSL